MSVVFDLLASVWDLIAPVSSKKASVSINPVFTPIKVNIVFQFKTLN
jgi:hypothetical protein